MKLASSSNLISGLPIRDLLQKITLPTNDKDVLIAKSIALGTTEETKQLRKKSHLTNATDLEHQIRFPLKNRVERNLKKLAFACSSELKKQNIAKISVNLETSDYLSHTILNFIALDGITIEQTDTFESFHNLLTAAEIAIIETLNSSNKNLTFITQYARERVYTGDYQTAISILSSLPINERLDNHHHLLGLCCNFFERTDEAEFHFKNLLASASILAQIKATYVLAMLYLRLHPKEKQDLEIAEKYLMQGHRLIENNPDIEDYYFHSVFNRNGYALCLYRRGQIQEALDMLDAGIAKLQNSHDGAKNLHQSVLIYNAVQCLKALNLFETCEKRCLQLLEVDPLFPEYWLELAAIYLEQSKFADALQTLQQAEKLDPFIPEIFALKGYLFLNDDKIPEAIENYSEAVRLAPTNTQFASDLEYCVGLA